MGNTENSHSPRVYIVNNNDLRAIPSSYYHINKTLRETSPKERDRVVSELKTFCKNLAESNVAWYVLNLKTVPFTTMRENRSKQGILESKMKIGDNHKFLGIFTNNNYKKLSKNRISMYGIFVPN